MSFDSFDWAIMRYNRYVVWGAAKLKHDKCKLSVNTQLCGGATSILITMKFVTHNESHDFMEFSNFGVDQLQNWGTDQL